MSKDNLKLAVDFDGTIARVMSLVCALINIKAGTRYTYKDITSWDFWTNQGLEKEFWEIYDLLDHSDLRSNLRPYDLDTLDVLKKINRLTGKPIEILTCNHDDAVDSILQWFESWKERAPDVKIICIGRQTSKDKLELPYDIYIDDSPHMTEMIKDYPKKKMILMHTPWNHNIKDTNQIVRVNRWKDVIPNLYKMKAFPVVKYAQKELIGVKGKSGPTCAIGAYPDEDWYYK